MSEPLANKIRPEALEDFVGQDHLVGPGKPLRVAIEEGHLFSFLLWGPPGSGKTTLARIYANALDAEFYELSAVEAGKEDIKRVIGERGALQFSVKPKVLFIDEIHRFNKAQQDFLLPFVERGDLTLIGATTENPSFEVIPALLSRCRVFVLHEHTEADMDAIIKRTKLKVPKDARDWLAAIQAEIDDPDDCADVCSMCSGSGEGMADGTTCPFCRGGIRQKEMD
jgi:putative ATPase